MRKKHLFTKAAASGLLALSLLTSCAQSTEDAATTGAGGQSAETASMNTDVLENAGASSQTSQTNEAETSQSAATGTASPDAEATQGPFGTFTSYTQEGEEVNQDIFNQADLTMVNIWGTFCPPCIREMPDLAEISEEYADKGLQLVGIISDVTEAGTQDAQDIIDATGADYTHIVLSESLYTNVLWQIQSVPTTIFLDSEGRQVGSAIVGSREKEDWILIIEEMLAEVGNEGE